jgi:membrane-associated phospholipid phosphatase
MYRPAAWWSLLVLTLVNTAVVLAAGRMRYFPGDVFFARATQAIAPLPVGFSRWIPATAETPWCFILLGLAIAAAWWLAGLRAAAVAVPVFFGLWLLGLWLSPQIAQPRPSPDLIHVVGNPRGYAFPSIFGLIYAATFGYVCVIAAIRARGTLRIAIVLAGLVCLVVGAIARIDMGAHWPSDLWAAYLIALWWIMLLVPLAIPWRGSEDALG